MASKRKKDIPADANFDADLWSSTMTPKKLIKEIDEYINEFDTFDPNLFSEINFHLFRDGPNYASYVNLCKVARAVDKCKKCIRANTKDCHLLVPHVAQEKVAISERVLNLVKDTCEFFTSDKKAYVRFPVKEHLEIHPVKSTSFSRYLAYKLYKDEGRPPTGESLTNAINVLAALSHFEGEVYQLQNRVGWLDGSIYFDLSDEENHVIEVNSEGWEIRERTRIPLFQRYNHQRPSEFPEYPTDIDADTLNREVFYLLDFLNHDKTDEDIRLLIIVAIISYFIPDIPHPVFAVFGSHGTAKSTFFQVVKNLVDPSKLGTQSFPKGIDNLVQSLFHQWFIGYDNVGDLPDWLSDYLCRAVTGEGFVKREIYTIEDDVIFTYKRCIGLNGINNAATKPDLLDRSILINLPQIPDSERISEENFWISFRQAKPRLLGHIFTVIARAIKIRPSITLSGLYRLADWTVWGAAISEALGIDSQKFLDAYGNNRNTQTFEAIDNSDLGTVVVQFANEVQFWTGTMSDLFTELKSRAEKLNIATTGESWPKSPNSLSRKLNPLEDTLKQLGIEVSRTRSNKIRSIEIRLIGVDTPTKIRSGQGDITDYIDTDTEDIVTNIVTAKPEQNTPTGQNDDSDGSDDISTTPSSRIPKDVDEGSRGVREFEERWKDFLSRTSIFGSKFAISEWNLDNLYNREERGQLDQDLKDWEKEGRVLRNKQGEWRVVDRGAPEQGGSKK